MQQDQFANLRTLLAGFEARKRRSVEIAGTLPLNRWCFGLVGLALEGDTYRFGDIAELRVVELPPSEVELASALKNTSAFGAIGRYSANLRYELAIEHALETTELARAESVAWWILSAIRVRTGVEILVPVVADRPWSTIAACPEKGCVAKLLEDVPRAFRLDAPVAVRTADLDWVSQHLASFAHLLQDPRFALAVESLTTHLLQSSLRLSAAALWAGVEALFEISTELRFRLGLMIASYLEDRGATRVALFSRCKDLYDERSKAVHGSKITDDDLRKHIREVRGLLSRLLVKMTEAKTVPHAKDYEALILG